MDFLIHTDDYVAKSDLDPHTLTIEEGENYLTVNVTETNVFGHGFDAIITVPENNPGMLELDIAHVLDREVSEDGEEAVGLLMTAEAANALGQALIDYAELAGFNPNIADA